MTARLLMRPEEITADRGRWLSLRETGVTASEVAAILGLAPASYKTSSPFALYVAKVTGTEPVGDSDEMARGRHLEPYVAELFEGTHPDLAVYPGGLYCNEARPWQMATFDRLSADGAGHLALGSLLDAVLLPDRAVMPVQIKTAATPRNHPEDGQHWGEPGSADIPVHIRCQALWEMDVAGAASALVPCLFMAEWKVHTYVIDRTDAVEHDLDIMRAEALDFLDRIDHREPPPVDWKPATTAALKTLFPMVDGTEAVVRKRTADRYRAALRASKRAERMMGEAVNQLRAESGGARFIFTRDRGQVVKVASRAVYPQEYNDAKLLKARHPRAFKMTRRSTPVDKLSPGTWAKAEL